MQDGGGQERSLPTALPVAQPLVTNWLKRVFRLRAPCWSCFLTAARQTEACERGQVPALPKAAQVAAPGMQGGTGGRFLPVTQPCRAGEGRFLPPSWAVPSQAPAPTGTHAAPPPKQGTQSFCRMAASCPAIARQGHVQPAARAPPGPAARPRSRRKAVPTPGEDVSQLPESSPALQLLFY